MRSLIDSWRARVSAGQDVAAQPAERELARVDALLARDLEHAWPTPSAELAPDIRRALRVARRPEGWGLRALALAAAAALAFALFSLPSAELPRSEPAPPAPARRFALQGDLGRLLSAPDSAWLEALEAPLFAEARLLADDGERVARALAASLPSPLRRGLRLSL